MVDLTELRNAWDDAGPVPEYHYRVKGNLMYEWPTLFKAIERLLSDD